MNKQQKIEALEQRLQATKNQVTAAQIQIKELSEKNAAQSVRLKQMQRSDSDLIAAKKDANNLLNDIALYNLIFKPSKYELRMLEHISSRLSAIAYSDIKPNHILGAK